jgi:hypothetical protein
MRSPAVALAWEFWGRHRWGLAGVVALVTGFAAYCAAVPVSRQSASGSSIWFLIALCYVIGVFAYGFEARLETADSGFPARLFVLPVRTSVLVGWPMLQGIAAAVLLWLAWDTLVLRPCGITTPAWWAVMLAAAVATSQALVWLPFGLPWLRIVVLVAALIAMVRAPAILALVGGPFTTLGTEGSALSLCAATLILSAFLLARAGVARARRGDSPDWTWVVRSPRVAGGSGRERLPFASAMQAQVWFEWRLRGRGFVVTVTIVVAVLMAVGLLLERRSTRADLGLIFLLMPPLIAAYWGSVMGSPGESIRSTALTAFAATRPLDNASLVVAKFRAATRAAAVTWAVVLAATAGWLALTAEYDKLSLAWEASVERHGAERVIGFCVLLLVGLVLGTWRALVANLWVGLTGRAWMVPAQTIVMSLLVLYGLAEWVHWDSDPARRARLLEWLPRVAAAVVVVKLLVAGWLLRVLCGRGKVEAITAGRLLGGWVLAAITLFALLVWVVPSGLVPVYGLALGVILFLPLARLAVAPLALAWNRHR